ncbi:hypothetical protein C9374_011128 [Naegleria lovaniensis]|uniref:Calcineurin-like phosphoesterase domain-containing protein n=1 Tax=Naegleria lovaniensis TaxID=51637 RepID=A0AA88GER2_NAELO|nr:uncharacterized protein C9374_011128 [Naegleria lovaniensis]KAG2374049.1 hypothetical protein C9374_011128 [Naegleria lovaniensis]
MEAFVSHLLDFYSKSILRNEYAITYLDNNYYSLCFLTGSILMMWTFLIAIPLSVIQTCFLKYNEFSTTSKRSNSRIWRIWPSTCSCFRQIESKWTHLKISTRSSSLEIHEKNLDHAANQHFEEIERHDLEESNHHEMRTVESNSLRTCLDTFTCIAFFISCVLLAFIFLLSSTFSKMHFMWSSLCMTSVFCMWLLGVFVLDVKRIVVGLVKNCRRRDNKHTQKTMELNHTSSTHSSNVSITLEEEMGHEEWNPEETHEEKLLSTIPKDTSSLQPVNPMEPMEDKTISTQQKHSQQEPFTPFSSRLMSLLRFCVNTKISHVVPSSRAGSLLSQMVKPRIANKPILFTTLILCVSVSLIFLFCTLLSYSLYHICIATDPIEISTLFSRTVLSNRTCALDDICFTYLTVPEHMNSQIIVNFQVSLSSGEQFFNPLVEFKKFNPALSFNPDTIRNHLDFWNFLRTEQTLAQQAKCFRMENIFEEIRFQCLAEITTLESDSSYMVRAVFESDPNSSRKRHIGSILKFRTTPSEEHFTKNIPFLNGGDLSWREPTFALAKYIHSLGMNDHSPKQMEDLAPYFAIVGGDVSYDNGCSACYRRWDDWFQKWNLYMTTSISYESEGGLMDSQHDERRNDENDRALEIQKNFEISHVYSLPMLTAVGNHEAGNFMRPRSDNSYYIRYFPMSISNESTATLWKDQHRMEDPQFTRSLQHVHYLSRHTMIVVLDSWVHESPFDQVQYLIDLFESSELKKKQQFVKNRIVVIHHPMYSSEKIKTVISKEMIMAWEILFLKYNVTAVFENHVHAYKQTYPIKEGKVVTTQSASQLGEFETQDDNSLFVYEKRPHEYSQHGIIYIGDGSWGVTNWDPSLDFENPIFRQVGYLSHVFHVNTRELESGEVVLDLSALGYNTTTESIHQVEGSRLRILTG